MQDLAKKHCVPSEDGVDPYTKEQAQDYLKATPDWEILDETPMKIQRKFVFKDFKQAIEFVNKVAEITNSEDHHPDINLHNYKKVDITLYTHAIGGLSENDYIMAAKISQMF